MLRTILQSRSDSPHRGSTNRAALALISSGVVLAALILLLSPNSPPEELTIYCAAGLREPIEGFRDAYRREHGVLLTIQYGGSSTLLGNLRLNHDADLFLPADESYIEIAKNDGLITETLSIAQMRPILAVKKSNPLAIRSLDDLLTKNARISMTDPSAAATGKLVQSALEKAGRWDAFKPRVTVFKATVSEVAADLQIGAADAGIIWDAMLKQLTNFEEVPLPELSGVTARVVAGVVTKSKHPQAARDFAAFLAAPDKGQRYFLDAGFSRPAAAEATR